jgi:hypothetical protein
MPTQVKDDQATPHGTDAREFRAPGVSHQHLKYSSLAIAACVIALVFVGVSHQFSKRAWAVGGIQRAETIRACSSFQPRYTVPLVARSRGLARCSAPSSPGRDTRLAHRPDAPPILTDPDRAHLAGTVMPTGDLPPTLNAVRAVGRGTQAISLCHTSPARRRCHMEEVDHGQVTTNVQTTNEKLPRGVSCHGAPRHFYSFAPAVGGCHHSPTDSRCHTDQSHWWAAFDRPHRSLHSLFHNGPGADTPTAARAVGLVRLVERRTPAGRRCHIDCTQAFSKGVHS